jgi:predicted MFS family arabinose efflux permease
VVVRTDWKQVVLLLVAGVVGATQLAKVGIAAPLLRADPGASIVVLGWIAGAYSVVGIIGSLMVGFAGASLPLRRLVVAGLFVLAGSSVLGSIATGPSWLIVSRLVEGIGFLLVAVACPALLRQCAQPRHHAFVLAAWAAYIPLGGAIVLFAGPAVMDGDWRRLWVIGALAAAINAVSMLIIRPADWHQSPRAVAAGLRDLAMVLTSQPALLLAAMFMLHGVQFYALLTFLPTFAVDRLGLTLGAAGTITSVALIGAVAGNMLGGALRNRAIAAGAVTGLAFLVVMVCGTLIFIPGAPIIAVLIASLLSFTLTGLLPSTVIASMPAHAGSPARVVMAMGLVQQASSTAAVFGPVLLAGWVDHFGWERVSLLYFGIGVLGTVTAWRLRKVEARASKRA